MLVESVFACALKSDALSTTGTVWLAGVKDDGTDVVGGHGAQIGRPKVQHQIVVDVITIDHCLSTLRKLEVV